MPKQVYLPSLQWEVAENLLIKMINAAWRQERIEELDKIFPELHAHGLTYSEASSFVWAVGKSAIAERGPSDRMLEWIYQTFFVHSPYPLRDWGVLAQSLHRERSGRLPPKWILHTSRILSDENDTGILEFPKEWIFAWASQQKDSLEYCYGNFVRPALKSWSPAEGQKLLGLLESQATDTYSMHCALLAGASEVSFDIPLSKICAIFWPDDLDKWLTLETLEADHATWTRLLINNECSSSKAFLPAEVSFT